MPGYRRTAELGVTGDGAVRADRGGHVGDREAERRERVGPVRREGEDVAGGEDPGRREVPPLPACADARRAAGADGHAVDLRDDPAAAPDGDVERADLAQAGG